MPELNSLIASILPYALGAAVSPVILSTILTTVSPTRSPRLASFSYLFGAIIFFLIVAFSGMYIGSGLSAVALGVIHIGAITEVVIGCILIIIALKTFFVREEPREGGLLGFVGSLREDKSFSTFIKFFYFGFITFLASFTTDILVFQAGVLIGLSNPGFTIAAEAVIVLGIITLLVVEVPFIIYLIFSNRADNSLASVSNWTVNYGYYITTIFYLLLGFFLIIRGLIFI
ncbi:GAP family protein [Methanobacterium sp.]|uniref:GAP family protein n=1 Tax=Methanobacterium sp. TaxID=2164 RepID=UPI003C717E02